jgi:hypothetical protein
MVAELAEILQTFLKRQVLKSAYYVQEYYFAYVHSFRIYFTNTILTDKTTWIINAILYAISKPL